MPQHYRFKAKNWQGKCIKGYLTAENPDEAVNHLYSKNLVPLEINKQRNFFCFDKSCLVNLVQRIGLRHYTSRDMMIFCRQLATMLQAGISLLQAINILATEIEKPVFRNKLSLAAAALESGSSLSAALRQQKFFPILLINMIEAGESGGILEKVSEKMADHYEKQHDLEEKIRAAVAYPVLVATVAFAVILVMILVVLPQFANIFSSIGMEMPLFSRLLLTVGQAVFHYWPLTILFVVLLAGFLSWFLQTERGRRNLDLLKLRLPLFGKIYTNVITARFSRTLGTLLASGVTLYDALQLADNIVDNRVVSASIKELSDAIRSGETMAGPIRQIKYFPSLLAEMVRVGEETGSLDYTLNKTAHFYEREVTYVVERLSSILEPALLLVVGLFIGLIVFSILSPMYQVFQMI